MCLFSRFLVSLPYSRENGNMFIEAIINRKSTLIRFATNGPCTKANAEGTMEYRNRILVVDDDNFQRIQLEAVLCEQYEVLSAADGQEALELLADIERVDLILLDIRMPGMNGYELHERLKNLTVCNGVPVIYLTGLEHPDEEIKGLSTGAADYITKPCAQDVLIARVESRLRGAKRLDMKKLSAIPESFSDMELTVLQMAATSLSNDEIAEAMGYSTGHTRNTISKLMQKLQVDDRKILKSFIL